MGQNPSLPTLKFILLFAGCIFLGMSLGVALTMLVKFWMQNGNSWYTSITILAVNHLSIYLIPALAYWYWFESATWKDFNRRSFNSVSALSAGILSGIVLLPFNGILINWNKGIVFADVFSGIEQWMIQKDQANNVLMTKLMDFTALDQLFITLIVSALIAAVGEEIFFRGIIQSKLIQGTKSVHSGVWLSAILFSAIHLQFFGFFPRLVLGALFGYLYVFSGNLWVAILAHFINNALFILTKYMEHQSINDDLNFHFPLDSWLIGACSLISSILLLIYFRKKNGDFSSKVHF